MGLELGGLKASEFTLEQLRYRQHDVFSPGPTNDLDADWQAFWRCTASHNRAGPAGQVISHRIAERFQILGAFAAVLHRGQSVDRAQDDVVTLHEREHPAPAVIHTRHRVDDFLVRRGRCFEGPLQCAFRPARASRFVQFPDQWRITAIPGIHHDIVGRLDPRRPYLLDPSTGVRQTLSFRSRQAKPGGGG